MIKVSVIMPVYNAEKYLEETLDCLIRQTLKEIEIICIDDGSTDQSYSILDRYRCKDARILVLQQENAGAGAARNFGIQNASGEYLSILDADDIFERDMLEALYQKAKEHQDDICVCKMDKFMDGSRQRRPCHWSLSKRQLPDFEPFTYKDITENIFKAFVGWTWDKLFRRAFVLENKLLFQHLRTTNDMFFTFTALVKAEKISILSRTLVHQRTGLESSLSATREKSWNCFYEALLALRGELVEMGIYEEVERSYVNYALHFSLWNLNTLSSPTFETLYAKLADEYFAELGIVQKSRDYFWNQEEYKKYRQIMTLEPKEYRIANKMEPAYKAYPYRARQMQRSRNPKVSILIPIYNAEHYLVECLNSVVNQTLEDIEIICINDGSTDHSLDIVKKFAAKDQRFVILDGPNGGYGRAVNRGLDAAAGHYIGIVESDDYVELDMYETLYQTAVEENVDFIKADFNHFTGEGDGRKFTLNQVAAASRQLYNQVVSSKEHPVVFRFIMNTWSGIYRRSFLNENHIRHNETPGASYQDNGFWFQTFCFAQRMYFLNRAFYQNRRDNPNAAVRDKSKVYCICEEYAYIYGFLQKHLEFKERFIGYYQLKKYHNYMMTFNRIPDERKLEFVNRMHEEFKDSFEKNELPEEIFSDLEWDMIQELIASPMDYYAHRYARSHKERAARLEREIAQIKVSKTWKLGKMIAYIPQQILKRLPRK